MKYYLIVDGKKKSCLNYADMQQKSFWHKLNGRKVEEVIEK